MKIRKRSNYNGNKKRALQWKYRNVLITMKIRKRSNYNDNMETC